METAIEFAELSARAHRAWAELVSGSAASPWWNAIIVTAGSERQAERYTSEFRRRQRHGHVPPGVTYLAVPDPAGRRVGSGGATLNALRALVEKNETRTVEELQRWWAANRVLIIHSGGQSQRLPQYSVSGKLFGALPVQTPWGEMSTVFDEMLALSTEWATRLPAGLVVASGDVVLTFDAAQLDWSRPGVTGVALRKDAATASQHGVYVVDAHDRVYSFLQKPSLAETEAAGGLLPRDLVAVDSGLLRFDSDISASLSRLSLDEGVGSMPFIDLYRHFTMALTGQWKPDAATPGVLHRLFATLHGSPFWCSVLDGAFTHVGTTRSFHRIFTEHTDFKLLYEARQQVEVPAQAGLQSDGVVIDSVLGGGGEVGRASLVLECMLDVPVHASVASILHGLHGQTSAIDVPENTVVHQVPVRLPSGTQSVIIRVYGVDDDPKTACWFAQPIPESLRRLGIDEKKVWPNLSGGDRTLWNAELFPVGTPDEAWKWARWFLGANTDLTADAWAATTRLSLGKSTELADSTRIADLQSTRFSLGWERTAVALSLAGADIRPLLQNTPGVAPLAGVGRRLEREAESAVISRPSDAASLLYRAGLFYARSGLLSEYERASELAFGCVQKAIVSGPESATPAIGREWRWDEVRVSAPPRIDMGGGWSDTPPFCVDWGGMVLNIALELNGSYPIRASARRIEELVIRCGDVDFTTTEEVLAPFVPGSPLTIPRAALARCGLVRAGEDLAENLRSRGGGIEICTDVELPMGSGLGTSSILAAAVLRALTEMCGAALDDFALSDLVMQLEQMMTTGGGWQDQAGGIFPGAKLISSGPGCPQKLRVDPVAWSAETRRDFESRLVLCDTGIQRMAKNLLRQVVGSYLAREMGTLQVLHGIKALAFEMSHAMREREWEHLGQLMTRHWEFNQQLDRHTTNAPINSLLASVAPLISGAKLAGAGGGGFMILLARDPDCAAQVRSQLERVVDFRISDEGMRIERVPLGEGRRNAGART